MKTIIAMLVILFTGTAGQAQVSLAKHTMTDTIPILRDTAVKDYVTMQGGKMLIVKNNRTIRMTKDMTMKDGTIVNPNGSVKLPDGHTVQLHEGDRVYMNGQIEGPEKTPV